MLWHGSRHDYTWRWPNYEIEEPTTDSDILKSPEYCYRVFYRCE